MSDTGLSVKDELRKFVIHNYLVGSQSEKLSGSDSFLEKGIIDSIGVIELAAFIQNRFKIKMEVSEIVPANLDTLDNLESFVFRKLKAK